MSDNQAGVAGSGRIVDGYGDAYSVDELQGRDDYRQAHSYQGIDEKFVRDMWDIFDSAGSLLLLKHRAYGPLNVAQAPGGPENGLRVRMWDKMARLNHILNNPGVDTNDESLEDTLTDLLNYCAIFIMVRRNQWPQK